MERAVAMRPRPRVVAVWLARGSGLTSGGGALPNVSMKADQTGCRGLQATSDVVWSETIICQITKSIRRKAALSAVNR